MRWWYVFVIIIGTFLGWWLLQQYGEQRSTKVSIIDEKNIQFETSKQEKKIVSDYQDNAVQTVEVVGKVISWDSENGMLEFDKDKKIWRVKITFPETIMVVKKMNADMKLISVSKTNDPNWRTGFCMGDEVVLYMLKDRVINIFNNGPRHCGFKDK